MTELDRDGLVAIINGTHLCLLRRPRQQPSDESITITTRSCLGAPNVSASASASTSTTKDEKSDRTDKQIDDDGTAAAAAADKTISGKSTAVVPGLSIRFVPILLNQKEQILLCGYGNDDSNSRSNFDIGDDSSPSSQSESQFQSQSQSNLPEAFTHNNYWREFTVDNRLIEECYTRGCGRTHSSSSSSSSSNGNIYLECPHHYYLQQQEQKDNAHERHSCVGGGKSNGINGMAVVHANDDGGIYLLNNRTRVRNKSDSSALIMSKYGANNDCEGDHYDTFTLLLDSRFHRHHRRYHSNVDKSHNETMGIYEGIEEADEINEFLRVNNRNSGYIVADYFGCNALEQILFLPPIIDVDDKVESSRVISKNGCCDNDLQQMKCTLLYILMHSVLTDGNNLFHRQSHNKRYSKPWKQKKIRTFHQHNQTKNKRQPHLYSSLLTMPILERKYCKDSRAWIISLPSSSFVVQNNQSGIDIHDSKKRKMIDAHHQDQNKKSSKDCSTAIHSPSLSSSSSSPNEDNISAAMVNNGKNDNANSNTATEDLLATAPETSRPNSSSNWREKIRCGLQKRLQFELQKKQKLKDIQLIKEHVLQQNRTILQKLSLIDGLKVTKSRHSTAKPTSDNSNRTSRTNRTKNDGVIELNSSSSNSIYDGNTNSPMMLEMVRIRHKIYTADGMSSNALCVKFYLEVDVLLYHLGTQKSNGQGQQGTVSAAGSNHFLRDLQLSCSFDSIDDGQKQEQTQKQQNNIVVKTHSGVVPRLRKGECVTIVASVHVSGIRLTNGLSTPLSFTLNAFWNHGSIPLSIRGERGNGGNSSTSEGINTTLNMKGIALGSFVLPIESIFISSEHGSGMASIHETDFSTLLPVIEQEREREVDTSTSTSHKIFPSSAIYEYRKPRVLIIDVSKDLSADIIGEWKTNITSLNNKFVNGNHIDIYHDMEKMQIRVTALAESPEHRASLVELIVKYLPENAMVVKSFVEPIKKSSLVESMLTRAKEETELLEKHRSLMMAKLSPSDLSDHALAQSRTDELAARLMMLSRKGEQ